MFDKNNRNDGNMKIFQVIKTFFQQLSVENFFVHFAIEIDDFFTYHRKNISVNDYQPKPLEHVSAQNSWNSNVQSEIDLHVVEHNWNAFN